MSTPPIVAVVGWLTWTYAAGRTASEVWVSTWPSLWTSQRISGAPPRRSGGGASYGPPSGGPLCGRRTNDNVIRWSIWSVRLRWTMSTTAIATARYTIATTAVAARATRIEMRRTLGRAA